MPVAHPVEPAPPALAHRGTLAFGCGLYPRLEAALLIGSKVFVARIIAGDSRIQPSRRARAVASRCGPGRFELRLECVGHLAEPRQVAAALRLGGDGLGGEQKDDHGEHEVILPHQGANGNPLAFPRRFGGQGAVDEPAFLQALRSLPLHPGARGLRDDAAVVGGFVLTTDTLVEGVHFLPADPPGDVAWKLLSVNLSDLAAKGATPEGVLLNHPLSASDWDRAFLTGFAEALTAFGCLLIGGDTVSLPAGAPRVLTLTALGRDAAAPSRTGARAGDALWVTGTIGDAGAGLRIARGEAGPAEMLDAYRRPQPRLAEGRLLAPLVSAMSDVSDGLLIDAARIAEASGLAVTIDLAAVPLSPALLGFDPDPLAAATAGDDYELLFALAAGRTPPVPATRVGTFAAGAGLTLTSNGAPVPLPARLGYQHGAI